MAESLYDIAENLREQILSSSNREQTAAEFLNSYGRATNSSDIIVLLDGTPIVKDDKGKNYEKDELERTKKQISEQLDLFSGIEMPNTHEDGENPEESKRGKQTSRRGGIYPRGNPILRDGVSAYYSPEKGWNGKEENPWTVKGAWDRFGFVDFLGMEVHRPKDVAEMMSIYRNPMLEYFHILLLKDEKIVHQAAMTSGLSGLVKVVPAGGFDTLREQFEKIDYNQAYLVHNHPSGNVSPSYDDIGSTAGFIVKVFGDKFRGHIILDHNTFALLEAEAFPLKRLSDISITHCAYRPHKIPARGPIYGKVASPDDVAWIVFDLHGKGNMTVDLDNEHAVIGFSPFSVEDYDPMRFMLDMKENCIRNRIIVVSSEEDFQKLKEKFREAPKDSYGDRLYPFLDCMYIDTEKRIHKSMLEHGWIDRFNWQSFLAKELDDNNLRWNENIADHPRQGYLFESERPYQSSILKPNWKDLDTYNECLSSYQGKGSVPIQDSSLVLEVLGYPEGKVCLSENAIENARKDGQKSEILQIVPQIVSDPAAIIDTGLRFREESRTCLLFAYNTSIGDSPATVALLVEPVETKRRTEYVVQMVFSPEEVSRDENKLFTVCAMNNQFIYSDLAKPFFITPGSSPDERMKTTEIKLPQEIPHKTAVIDYCLDKAIRRARRNERR